MVGGAIQTRAFSRPFRQQPRLPRLQRGLPSRFQANHRAAHRSQFTTTEPAIAENQPYYTIVGEFNATDPEGDFNLIPFYLWKNNNSLFTLDNGTLKTATTFDYESNASSFTIRLEARDEYNASVEGKFYGNTAECKRTNQWFSSRSAVHRAWTNPRGEFSL